MIIYHNRGLPSFSVEIRYKKPYYHHSILHIDKLSRRLTLREHLEEKRIVKENKKQSIPTTSRMFLKIPIFYPYPIPTFRYIKDTIYDTIKDTIKNTVFAFLSMFDRRPDSVIDSNIDASSIRIIQKLKTRITLKSQTFYRCPSVVIFESFL